MELFLLFVGINHVFLCWTITFPYENIEIAVKLSNCAECIKTSQNGVATGAFDHLFELGF